MIHLGTSGWQYRHWDGLFYPDSLPQGRWLEHYAERFETVELNNSFYRLPARTTFAGWRRRTPAGFVFAVKMSRFLTHVKKLNDPAEPIHRFFEAASGLGDKLGPVLLQLPPSLGVNVEKLDAALKLMPRSARVAVEFRHPSWFTEEVRHLLEHHAAALCLADSPARATPHWRTASWGFLRFHEGSGKPRPCYQRSALERWCEVLRDEFSTKAELFGYFNNDTAGCALADVATFAALASQRDFRVSRVEPGLKVAPSPSGPRVQPIGGT